MSNIPFIIRKQILAKYNRCQICGCEEPKSRYIWFEIDHIIPRRFGGTNDINNLTVLCNICNTKKSSLYGEPINTKIKMLNDKISFLNKIKDMQQKVIYEQQKQAPK